MKYRTHNYNEKPFNMDLIFLERINNRLDELDTATIEGNQVIRHRLLEAIFMDTFFKYAEHKNEIWGRLKEIEKLMQAQPAGSKSLQLQHNAVVQSEAKELLDLLFMDISFLLYKHHIIHLKATPKIAPIDEMESEYR